MPRKRPRQLDQLEINLAHLRKIDVGDLHLDAGHLLNLLQDVEAAPAAIALERVGRIGHELQLLQDELRDDERAVDEAGLADVRDAAVDDDARVEDLVAPLRPRRAEQADEPRRLEPFAVLAAQDETEVRQDDQDEAVQELYAPIAAVGPEEAGANRMGDAEADRAADERPEHAGDGGFTQAALEQHDERGEDEGEADVGKESNRERKENRGGVGDGGDEEHSRERKPSHGATPEL